jgi:hypothetical protein
MRLSVLALLVLLGAASSPAAERAPPRLIIIQPGYPGSTQDARAFIATLSEYLESKTGLKGLTGEYHNEAKPGLRAIKEDRPAFGMVSLGFYLEHRKALGLVARLQARPKDRIVLIARGGDIKDLAALKGEAVAGGPLHEKAFLERIAFAGKADVASWDAQPTLQASRALRDLAQGKKYRAVVLTGRDFAVLGELYSGKTLEKVAESDYYPPALVVAFTGTPAGKGQEKTAEPGKEKNGAREEKKSEGAGREAKSTGKETERASGGVGTEPEPGGPLSPEELEKVLGALSGLPGDPQGREILEAMGAEGFEDLPKGWLEEMEGGFDAREKK